MNQEVGEMIFSSNENMLINLLNFEDYVSAKDLSSTLFVSTKTVYRMIKKINELFMEEQQAVLIVAEPGKGYRLNAVYRNKSLHSIVAFTEENSLNEIVLALLFNHPKKIKKSIMDNQKFSERTIERRLRNISDILSNYDLTLNTSRDYLWVIGEEIQLRQAINSIFLEMNKINRLSEFGIKLNAIDKYFIDQQISLIEEVMGEYISYPYDITIYTHIYLIIKRYRDGEVYYLGNQEPLEKEEQQMMDANPKMKEVAEKIIKNIEQYLARKMDSLEIYFIFQNIYSVNIQKRESSNIDKKLAEEVTKKFITDYFSISDVSLLPLSRSLYEALYQHILPMLSRLRLNIKVENNLLDELMVEYRETFQKLKKTAQFINQELMFDTKMNDAEIGYLTLYFEKYKFDRQEKLNVLLVCSTGIGTSELLKVRVQQNFPNLTIVATMSQRQLKKNQQFIRENVDMIFSTIRVPFNMHALPVLTISPLLTDKDIQNINYAFKEMK